MNFIALESAEKLRGGFYTAPDVAAFLTQWVLEAKPARILEPSCGDGAFLEVLAAAAVHYPFQVCAWEIDPVEANKAQARVGSRPLNLHLRAEDFLKWFLGQSPDGAPFDAVMGNPPFIRYQYLPEEQQQFAEQIFGKFGLPFTRHTNAWVPFVMASLSLLRPGGRLALVVPSEILHIVHAQSLRRLLAAQCARVLVLDPEELWFDQTLQGVVLLLAEKKSPSQSTAAELAILSIRARTELHRPAAALFAQASFEPIDLGESKWMSALLSPSERTLLRGLRANPAICQFADLAEVDVGIVTGANKFFLVPDRVVEEFELQRWAHPMFGRSEHVSGLIYDATDHKANRRDGLPANFLWFDDLELSAFPPGVQAYLRSGVKQCLPQRYKCRVREPWFRVPSVYATPVAMLKRCHHFPRLILNTAAAYTTDTAYRIRTRQPAPVSLVYSFLNSLTCLCAELEGRHYGGGVLELVPSEIERLLIPWRVADEAELRALDCQFRSCREPELLLQQQDGYLLRTAGLTLDDSDTIHKAWDKLRRRRHRTPAPPDA